MHHFRLHMLPCIAMFVLAQAREGIF